MRRAFAHERYDATRALAIARVRHGEAIMSVAFAIGAPEDARTVSQGERNDACLHGRDGSRCSARFGGRAMLNGSGVSFAANDFGVGASVSLALDTISVVEEKTP